MLVCVWRNVVVCVHLKKHVLYANNQPLDTFSTADPGGRPYQQPPPYGAPYGATPYQPPSYAAPYGAPAPYGAYGAPAYAAPAYQQPPPAYAQYGGAYGAPQDPYAGGYGGAGGYGAPPAPAPAPSPWQAQLDEQGRTYYYNSQTGVSQWEKPAEMP